MTCNAFSPRSDHVLVWCSAGGIFGALPSFHHLPAHFVTRHTIYECSFMHFSGGAGDWWTTRYVRMAHGGGVGGYPCSPTHCMPIPGGGQGRDGTVGRDVRPRDGPRPAGGLPWPASCSLGTPIRRAPPLRHVVETPNTGVQKLTVMLLDLDIPLPFLQCYFKVSRFPTIPLSPCEGTERLRCNRKSKRNCD